MKKLLILGVLAAGAAWSLQGSAVGHGGTYRGPGDTVPPGGGGGGGGGGPANPGPSGPTAPGPSNPGAPGPSTPGGAGAAPGAATSGPVTGATESGVDLTKWEFWWGFNKEPYLNLKSFLHSGNILTGSDDFYLGHGTKDQAKDNLRPSPEEIRNKVVPALLKVLEDERANDIIDSSLIALAKIGDVTDAGGTSDFQASIAKFLDNSSQQIAETAAIALGILADEDAIPMLTGLLKDEPPGRKLVGKAEVPVRTRAFAAYGLGLIAYRSSSNETRQKIAYTLVDILNQPQFAQRDIKVAAMTAFGLCPIDSAPEATPTEEDLKDPNKPWVLSREKQLEFLLDYFDPAKEQANKNTRHWFVRAHAPAAMARLLDGQGEEQRAKVATALLGGIDKFSQEQREIQMSCALALGQVADASDDGKDDIDTKVRAELTRLAEEGEVQARRFALISLAQSGARPGSGDKGLDGADEVVRKLTEVLSRGKAGIQSWAGLAIGVLCRGQYDASIPQSEAALKALATIAADCKRPEDIGAYALGLGIAKYVAAHEVLSDRLEFFTGRDEAQGYVAVALGLMGDRTDIAHIQGIVRSSKYKPELLREAAIALGLLGDKELVPELIKMLENANSLSAQAAISTALGSIGDSRSLDPLVAMLLNKQLTDTARGFSAAALGIVCDKENFPWNSKISTNINYRANTVTLTGEGGTGILDLL